MKRPLFIWRVTNQKCGAWLAGAEFWQDEAKASAEKAAAKMAKDYDIKSKTLLVTMTGPRGGVLNFRQYRGRGPLRWIRG